MLLLLEAIERYAVSQDWITLLLLLVLVILMVAKYSFPQRFQDFLLLFATDKYLLLKGKQPKIFHPFNILFFVINIISASLFIFLFYTQLTNNTPERPVVVFLRIATAYTTFVLLKFSLEKILANIISLDAKMDYYLFHKLSYRNYMALALLPVSMAFIYTWNPTLTALYICIFIILLLNFIAVVSTYKKNQQFISSHWFYFILYLCALEIGPYFILYKLFTQL